MTRLPAKPLFYRLREAADLTGIPRATLYRRAKAGLLPHATIGGTDDSEKPTILIPRTAVERLILELDADAAHSTKAEPEEPRVRPITQASKRGRPKRSA